MPALAQPGGKVSLQGESGMVGGKRNLHGPQLGNLRGIRQRQPHQTSCSSRICSANSGRFRLGREFHVEPVLGLRRLLRGSWITFRSAEAMLASSLHAFQYALCQVPRNRARRRAENDLHFILSSKNKLNFVDHIVPLNSESALRPLEDAVSLDRRGSRKRLSFNFIVRSVTPRFAAHSAIRIELDAHY